MSKWIPSIGLEVHVQLRTRTKMFCGCGTLHGAPANTQVCPVCLGYPGSMPVMNGEAIRLTVVTGMVVGCRISGRSTFDRKSYFYPDMPKNFQISQYDKPLCEGGGVAIDTPAGSKTISLKRIHLEEDVAKNIHFASASGVDFNRAGIPLMEMVTEPDIANPEEAIAFLTALKQILLYAGVSDCNLEQGNMRCDVNCSLRPAGTEALGTKIELKNLNTFKGVYHALKHEIDRQASALEAGTRIVQETRRWDADSESTYSMRTKEDAHDYRYFPEPDLMPVEIAPSTIESWRSGLPELPAARRERMEREYSIPQYDAGVLAADRRVADFFEAAVKAGGAAKTVSNMMMTEMLRLLSEEEKEIAETKVTPQSLAGLARLIDGRKVNSTTAKEVFGILFHEGGDAEAVVKARGMGQVSDESAIEAIVDQAIRENPGPVADVKKGKTAAAKFLVGQVMKLSRGKADPQVAAKILNGRLGVES